MNINCKSSSIDQKTVQNTTQETENYQSESVLSFFLLRRPDSHEGFLFFCFLLDSDSVDLLPLLSESLSLELEPELELELPLPSFFSASFLLESDPESLSESLYAAIPAKPAEGALGSGSFFGSLRDKKCHGSTFKYNNVHSSTIMYIQVQYCTFKYNNVHSSTIMYIQVQ